MISDQPYTFTRVTPQDLPMIRAWLEEAHVRRWWGDPLEQVALIAGDGRFVGAFARGLLANGATRVIIDPDQSNQQAIGAYRKAGFAATSHTGP